MLLAEVLVTFVTLVTVLIDVHDGSIGKGELGDGGVDVQRHYDARDGRRVRGRRRDGIGDVPADGISDTRADDQGKRNSHESSGVCSNFRKCFCFFHLFSSLSVQRWKPNGDHLKD